MTSPQSDARLVYAVAPAIGLLAWPVAALFKSGIFSLIPGPAATIVPILVASSLTGLVVGAVASANAEPGSEQGFKETATRAGFVTALVAAAILVIRTTVLHAVPGQVTGLALLTLFHAVVTLLPATLFAMFTGGLSGAGSIAFRGNPDLGRPAFTFQPIHALYIGCALAFLAPFAPSFVSRPEPPRIVVSTPRPTPRPAVSAEPLVTSPPEPPFAYKIPAGFGLAEGARVQVLTQKALSDIDSASPVLLSPNGRLLAFRSESAQPPRLVIFDLDAFSEKARINLPGSPSALAWSPDGERLAAILRGDDGRMVAIAVPAEQRIIPLPRPESSAILDGGISWPVTDEVVLHPPGQPALALNLDRLELRPLSSAGFFTTLADAKKKEVSVLPGATVGQTAKWSFGLAWAVTAAGSHFVEGKPEFQSAAAPGLAVTDRTNGARTHLREVAIAGEQRAIFAPDGTKAVVVQGSDATVYYFGLRDLPSAVRRFDTKLKIEDFPQKEEIRKQLEGKQLCAFVSAPLLNPLNNKVVGAMGSQVKGIVRFLSWEGSAATVVMQEEFAPIGSGDVASVLHTWEKSELKVLADKAAPDWWAGLGAQVDASGEAAALANGYPHLEIGPSLSSRSGTYGHWMPSEPWSHGSEVRSSQPSRSTFRPAEQPPLPPATIPAPQNYAAIIGQFIVRHHEKSTAGNLDSLMRDYGDRVEHYQAGVISRDAVRAEEIKYHAPGYRVTERVRGRVQFRRLSPSRTEAKYELIFLRVKPDGSWATGAADVMLEIEMTTAGPLIVKQNSVSRESEKQRGESNPPNF